MADLLIGRSAQLDMLIKVLACAKLINITGALGIGKTFFAKQMYRSVTYAPKAFISLGTPGLISIEAEGVETYHIEPGMILDVLDMLDELGAGSCESLLVLDGCESALEPCLAMVESALVRFPTMRIVATSQVPLHIPGEICFELPPLSLPPSTVSTLQVYDSEKPQGIHIKLFGGFSLIGADGQIVVNGKPKKALAAIAANGGSIHADKLIEILWPYVDPKLARRRIRNVLLRLKQYSGSIVMRHDEEIKLNQTVEVDLIQFMNLARQSITALTNGSWGDHTHDNWNTAISTIQLYSGDLLPEYAYDEWVIDARERTKRLYISLLSLLARKACEEGSPAATGWLETLIAADPYDDSSYILLAELHYNEGRNLAALDTIRRARSVADNLEIPLSAKLLQLEERIRPKHR